MEQTQIADSHPLVLAASPIRMVGADPTRMIGVATNNAGQPWTTALLYGLLGGALGGALYGFVGEKWGWVPAAGVGAGIGGALAYYQWSKS